MISLDGTWACRLDSEDIGLKRRWQLERFDCADGGFAVPGTTATNGLGEHVDYGEAVDGTSTRCLRPRTEYRGVLWLQREVDIPEDLGGGLEFSAERVIFESSVWLDGHFAGRNTSLLCPHRVDLTPYARPGERQLLTVRIDNRDVEQIGDKSHSYTDETQSIWNGMVGAVGLEVLPRGIGDVQVFPEPASDRIRVRFTVRDDAVSTVNATIKAGDGTVLHRYENLPIRRGDNELTLDFLDWTPWNEFTPTVYTLCLGDARPVTFGMRRFERRGPGLYVNDLRLFLRGTCECCVFPKTGYPPCDIESWQHICAVVKVHGLNHIRFHSWCPPEAAFTAADEVGVYLSVEGPCWMDAWFDCQVGSRMPHFEFIKGELARVVREHGNHPSFFALLVGNELSGDFTLMEDALADIKRVDGRRLYSLTSNTVNFDRVPTPTDGYFAGVSFDGIPIRGQGFLDQMVEETTLSYDDAVEAAQFPLVAHELGQYAVFPDVSEIDQCDGALDPVNLKVIRDDLERKGLLAHAKDFVLASGHLAGELYRADIESTARTRDFAGYQMLDLHDFPGQGTATVGILNAFWESKGLGPKADLHTGAVLPLMVTDRLVYFDDECAHARLSVFNYGSSAIPAGAWSWCAGDANGTVDAPEIPQGSLTDIGAVDIELASAHRTGRVPFSIASPDGTARNDWDLWVYRREAARGFGPDVTVSDSYDDSVKAALAQGGKAVILANPSLVRKARKGEFFPVFWSPVFFKSADPCGMVVDAAHPVFKGFDTESFSELNWKNALEHSFGIDLGALPGAFEPITLTVPNFMHIEKVSNLFECKVGEGKLLVTSLGLDDVADPSVLALRNSIVDYVESDVFQPAQEVEGAAIESLFDASARRDDSVNLAAGKPTATDSCKSKSRGSDMAVDGSPLTFWESMNMSDGHWWQVDLEEPHRVSHVDILLQERQDTEIVLEGSLDGEAWERIGGGRQDGIEFSYALEPVTCRFVRATFHQPFDLDASMVSFSIR